MTGIETNGDEEEFREFPAKSAAENLDGRETWKEMDVENLDKALESFPEVVGNPTLRLSESSLSLKVKDDYDEFAAVHPSEKCRGGGHHASILNMDEAPLRRNRPREVYLVRS